MLGHGAHEKNLVGEYSDVDMNNKISLPTIAWAIEKTCVMDKLAPKPLSLKRNAGNKNKSIGRLLMIYFAAQEGISKADVMNYLELTDERYNKGFLKMCQLLETGRTLFELRERPTDSPALFFYRKMLIIQSTLHGRI